jgi:hypothetical protein
MHKKEFMEAVSAKALPSTLYDVLLRNRKHEQRKTDKKLPCNFSN